VSEAAKPKTATAPRRRRWLRVLTAAFVSLIVLLAMLVAGASYYTTTADFQRRVGAEVVSVLEDSTGGKVEVGHISFSLWHLAIEVDGLTIHGTEGPGEAPYLSAAKIFLRVRINTFISHTVGKGAQSHIGLNYLRVEEPHVHLIIDQNGNTNQPTPKHPSTSTEPVQDTLLDLQAGDVQLVNGLAVVNDRAIPFDLAANDLGVEVKYLSASDRYGISVDLADLRTKMAKEPEVQSKLALTAELGRDVAELKSFSFVTGASTQVTATALIDHFAKPEWQASVQGQMDLKQVGLLAGVDGFSTGRIELDVNGRNCNVTPEVAQQKPHFWQRRKPSPAANPKMIAPDPQCVAGYLLAGAVKLHDASYRNEYVRLHGINGGAQLHVTPQELLFTALSGYLPGGGSAEGDLKIENWLGEVPPNAPATSATTVAAAQTANTAAKGVGAQAPVQSVTLPTVAPAHAFLTVTVNHIPLRTIMDITAPQDYGDLGFDTSITGPTKVQWGGPAKDIASSVMVDADLKFAPVGLKRRGALSDIPVSGEVLGHYDGVTETVTIPHITLQTPQTTLAANGVLGVNEGDPLTNLQLNLQARDLGEFDQLFQTLGLEANGKKGTAAIPVVLHGTLGFTGSARGAVKNLDVKGHLVADNLLVHLGTEADVHIDSVVADAEYSPNGGVSVASSTVKRGTAVLNVAGAFKPHRVVSRSGVVDYLWDKDLGINATVKMADAQAFDLLQIAGQQQKIPLTGTVNVNGHVTGTLSSLNGAGNITLTNGAAYGEAYQTISVDVNAQGEEIDATKVLVTAHGMSVMGSGGYNVASKHVQAKLAGNGIVLSKLDTFKKAVPNADGVLSFSADANGTMQEPNLHAQISLAKIVANGNALGQMNATAYSTGSNVFYDVHSTLIGAQVAANGETSLLGDYMTQTKLTLSGLDIANVFALSATSSVKASSQIAGTITVSGPAAKPMELTGTASFDQVDLKLQGVELKSSGPLMASLHNGVVKLDQVHITGEDTDLSAGGTVQVLGSTDPNGGAINLTSTGSVSMLIAHTFDPDLITSGKVTFQVAADGRIKKPTLTGNVKFVNVNMAVDGIPNGLSNMNGTLVFNENRLDVQDLTATTGGGQLKIGGSLVYQNGVFANLTATGDAVRVRLYGLSTTATSSFRLQGNQQSLLLSGNVLITRFGIGPDVDFAAFAGTGGVSLPPDPNSATNKIRLDVHVTSAPQLDFQNSYAKLAGTVDLTVRGTLAVPSVLGTIRITDGSATFAGTKYELERGTIYFSNPVRIDPVIDLDASARVENYDITIGLHGTTTSLKPTYRSEPPLTEADIFNLLALGRTQEEAQLYQEQQVQAGTDPTTSALLGGALNATVSSRVGKLFGAGSVKIDPAFVGTLGNSAARITVQEPLSKQLTLVFATNVNQTAEQLIQLQYQITDSTSLVATRDENGVFSVVYKIRKRYR
jgi:translocation and assembly module TamB